MVLELRPPYTISTELPYDLNFYIRVESSPSVIFPAPIHPGFYPSDAIRPAEAVASSAR